MSKFLLLFVVILATTTFAKEDSSGKKKEDVGTVIGIDLGVSFLLHLQSISFKYFRQLIPVLEFSKMVV